MIRWNTTKIKHKMATLGINCHQLADKTIKSPATIYDAVKRGKGTDKTFFAICTILQLDPKKICSSENNNEDG